MKVIIIGNGIAANTAGSIIRRLDARTDITLISEERYPLYSPCALPHYLAGQLQRRKLFLKTKEDYRRDGIRTILGRKVTRVSPEEKKVFCDTKSLSYDKLVLATGSKPIIPPRIKGVELDGILTLKSLDDAERILSHLGKTAVVIGSGPIGVETSAALAKTGLRVYLVESLNRIMPRVFDEGPASLLRKIIEERGIKVLTGESVTSIIGNGRVEAVVTEKRRIKCDMVILSAGVRPNVELAQKSELSIGTLGGISVTRQMTTSFRDIYAGGDCVEAEDMLTGKHSLSLLWHNAKRQGEVIGFNCSGIPRSYSGSLNITSLNVFGSNASSFGPVEADVKGNKDIEIVERHQGENYRRLLLCQGRLVGVQSVGHTQDMGALLFALMGRHSLNEIEQMIDKKAIAGLSPWYFTVARCMAAMHHSCAQTG